MSENKPFLANYCAAVEAINLSGLFNKGSKSWSRREGLVACTLGAVANLDIPDGLA